MCRQAGVIRATTIEEAYEVAATFATQPEPRGNRVAVVSTAGGWGVVTADAIAGTDLDLMALPDDLVAALDDELPPRWSRNNPIDMAGGETKDTITTVLEIVARHPEVDAVVLLGMGIQSNQGRMEREGPFYPDHGLERIAAYHDRQDHRYTALAAALADELDKPVLVATELAVTFPDNAAVRGVVESGKLCYPVVQPGRPGARPPLERARDGANDARSEPPRLARMPRRLLVVAVALIALATLGPELASASTTTSARVPAPTAKLTTPVLSARRLPTLLEAPAADSHLLAAIAPIVAQANPTSCLEAKIDGRTIDDVRGSLPLMPASTEKLLTATALLAHVPATTTYETRAVSTASSSGGVLQGDLYVVGGGDPLLETTGYQPSQEDTEEPYNDFAKLAAAIKAAGDHVDPRQRDR